jgi:beta-galactosidase
MSIKSLLLLLTVFSFQCMAQSIPGESVRKKYNFNAEWKVLVGDPAGAEAVGFNDTAWKSVTLPYAWNEDDAFKKDIRDLRTGIAWYRKKFRVPGNITDKKIFLEFEGIRQGGEIFLNGKFIGRHENGTMAFGVDISEKINPEPAENVLALRIDNDWDYREKSTQTKFQWSDRNFNANYGGIPKNVFLHVTGKLYQTLPLFSTLGTTGVYVYATNFDIPGRAADITAEIQVHNEYPVGKRIQYDVVIEDIEGKIVALMEGGWAEIPPGGTTTLKASSRVHDLKFWSWGYGYRYKVYTVLKENNKPLDVVLTRTGFRKTAFTNGMVSLNDQVIHLKGYAQRTSNEWPAVGVSVPPWMSDFSNRMMVEGNANLVRWMHTTPWKQDVESCDRVGLLQAMPAGDSERDVTDRRWEQRVELMRDAIIYNRNNPSIVFYESGNEAVSEEHMQEMKSLRDRYDPYGGRAAGSREMLDSKVAEYGGEMLYINKSAGIPLWATEYSRDEGLRKYWDEYSPPYHKEGEGPLYKGQDASAYNHNQDAHAIENIIRWYDYWRERPGTGKRVNAGGVNIIFSDTNTHHRGAENYRRSGEVDAMRIPKDGYFTHKVMWDGWVETRKHGIHIMGHWNYKPGTTKDVVVVSTAEKIALFVNDKPAGASERSYHFLHTFKNIEWKAGTVKAIGYDKDGVKLCETQKATAGEPASIRLTPHTAPGGFKADGADMVLVDVEVIDANGVRCPTALNMIDFQLKGPAEWRGGIAQGPDNYILSQKLPVECGVNRIIVRSTTQPGKISLKAEAEGLKSSVVTWNAKPVKVTNGLSLTMPGDGLISFLDFGPTPSTPTCKVTRIPVDIVGATAGSAQENASLSCDDNENTRWENDGKQSTAWIKYDLKEVSSISEVVMKLNNWRRQEYPIRIIIDGQEAYKGTTTRTLGYCTVSFKPVRGQTLMVQLTGAGIDQDAFGGIVEVTGKVDQADSNNDRGVLSIIEMEIYRH